ncbi:MULTISPECIES: hypothetical protein [unclassified Pseudonocardia]|uniref:hypothetical protein n=1 Tax=unclassified Pseudonocardia TaxID=2619320 RepID=UPI001115313F|nr:MULTISPECIES: hypothetical protein [unclassified Pseudonocardia]
MTWQTEDLFDAATDLVDREARRLHALGAIAKNHPDKFDKEGVFAMSRALTYVVCGGILEKLMRDLPAAISDDVLSLRLQRSDVPSSLLAVLAASSFQKCNQRTTRTLIARVGLLVEAFQHASDARPMTAFGDDLALADGTTIAVAQFEALWVLLDLPGHWHNIPADALLMRELTQKRNDVAHWDIDPVDVGKSRNMADLVKITTQLRSLLDHVGLTVCEWLDGLTNSRPIQAAQAPGS